MNHTLTGSRVQGELATADASEHEKTRESDEHSVTNVQIASVIVIAIAQFITDMDFIFMSFYSGDETEHVCYDRSGYGLQDSDQNR